MKKLLLAAVLFLFLFAAFAFGQSGNALIIPGSGAPVGSCAFIMLWDRTDAAKFYYCDASTNTWVDLTGNQTITLSGDVTGSGTTAITTTVVNLPDGVTQAGHLLATSIAAPVSPAAGKVKLFTDSTDLRFHDKNAAGTIGTTVVADTGAANNFLTAISTAGVISKAQPTPTNVGLGNVTNDVQTKASIVPNTAPSAGQVPCGNAGGTAYAPCTIGGDATLSSTGALTVSTFGGVTPQAAVTWGAGLSAAGATASTASDEADFLKSGALTCGASTQGKMLVHTTPLQYCDNAATPALQYTAYGDSSGNAKTGDSATSFFASGTLETARLAADTKTKSCEISFGDGLNAIAAGTYLVTNCKNNTGSTLTISGIECFTDNAGTSTLNAANNSANGLLTGAVTCTPSFAAGTQSATTTLANGGWVNFTFVADGTTKRAAFNFKATL